MPDRHLMHFPSKPIINIKNGIASYEIIKARSLFFLHCSFSYTIVEML